MANITITHPELAKQWHPTKNGDLRAENFTKGSKQKIWWLCDKTNCSEKCIHEYYAQIRSRTNGTGCPYCSPNKLKVCIHNSIEIKCPELVKEWHPIKNDVLIKPEHFGIGSTIKVWWLCNNLTCNEGCKHEWESTINSRVKGSGCHYCCNPRQKICKHNSIVYTHPEITKQWHPTKNEGLDIETISYASNKIVWWLCDKTCSEACNHDWESSVDNRIKGNGCPHCSNRKICIHTSIVYTHPEITKQWHPTKNGNLKPENHSFGQGELIWWLCDKKCSEGCIHEWNQTINCRSSMICGCPYCSYPKKKVCIHESIVYTHPDIAKQWHPIKNGILRAEEYSHGSGEKVWWFKSVCNHEWEAEIVNRTGRLDGCPYCVNKTEQKLYDALIPHYIELKQQFKVEWCKKITYLPFDFVLAEDKIIIELDGLQHFEQVSNWQSPEETHLNDVYKMKCANENGYSVIRLLQTDVFYDTYDWLKELRENIEKIKLEKRVQNVYMCKDNEYAIFA